ncbi:Asp-tRNA(Asn)/Glu-tRNA(Gln) amidotransferase subunit GatC [Lampropedia puyangensis]|uniref:Aspartyl/glutamyl-tRNA(Asn/Gln) amidotransferase subunit C n=1 Tax=Lampropedia puyangensis TaxID=1330072 RepID=A0A4V4GQX2_9BURK|nr:Asp-tRNA(Asn)/Glu-tRNA(Gln) amidotransferase subunit GatC [Lampropedia puyangensis]THT99365.1 Asp-tRNA(Asn)/Glu-tRNA(Gln) amidotransferase subunit GatC [Lampropedia puyangensis]
MSLSLEEIQRIANLSKLSFDEPQSIAMQGKINSFFKLVEQMDSVDTEGVEPLFHPVSVVQDITLRLQDDVADTGNHREGNMQNAPAAQGGYFLVPKVIE